MYEKKYNLYFLFLSISIVFINASTQKVRLNDAQNRYNLNPNNIYDPLFADLADPSNKTLIQIGNIKPEDLVSNSNNRSANFCTADKRVLERLKGPIGNVLQRIFLTQEDAYQIIQLFDNFYDSSDLHIISLLSILKALHIYKFAVPRNTPTAPNYVIIPNLHDYNVIITAFVKFKNLYYNQQSTEAFTPCSYNYVFANAASLYYNVLTYGSNRGFIIPRNNLSTNDINGLLRAIYKLYNEMYNIYQSTLKQQEYLNNNNFRPNDGLQTITIDPNVLINAFRKFLEFNYNQQQRIN